MTVIASSRELMELPHDNVVRLFNYAELFWFVGLLQIDVCMEFSLWNLTVIVSSREMVAEEITSVRTGGVDMKSTIQTIYCGYGVRR